MTVDFNQRKSAKKNSKRMSQKTEDGRRILSKVRLPREATGPVPIASRAICNTEKECLPVALAPARSLSTAICQAVNLLPSRA